MPRPSSLIRDRERQICGRVRALRLQLRMAQVEFAHLLDLSRDKLAAVEYECTPVRYALARAIWERFDVCQQWLGEGIPPKFGKVAIPLEIEAGIKPRALFSSVYDESLRGHVHAAIRQAGEAAKCFEMFQGGPKEAAQKYAGLLQTIWFERLPIEEQYALYRWLSGAASQFWHSDRKFFGQPVSAGAAEITPGKGLTSVNESSKQEGVKAVLPSLLERLCKATAERGRKSELAAFLRVQLPSLSVWLSGKQQPGGETTLRLLQWVERAEAQQKAPGSVEALPGGQQTRSRESSYEKPKPSPPKR